MMTKLKCYGYGKFVKQLFITSLISCFILLGNSFVSAYYSVGSSTPDNVLCVRNANGYYSDLSCENRCLINRDLSFSCSSSNNKIIYTNYQNGFQASFYRTTNGLARAILQNQYCGSDSALLDYSWRENLFTGFTLCEGDYYSGTSTNIPVCPGSQTILSYFEMLNYVKYHGGIDYYDIFFANGNISDIGLSFIGDGFYFQTSVRFTNNSVYWGIANPYNLGISKTSCTTGSYNVFLNKSFPGAVSNPMRFAGGFNTGEVELNPPSDKVYYSDNNGIYYDTFKAIGFYEGLCYSNFQLNDKIDIYTAYYDLFPSPSAGSGASVFDLYNDWIYSSTNPFRAWVSVYNNKYLKLENSSDKGTTYINTLYSGDSKGDFYIIEKLNNAVFIDSYSFSPIDYETFCNMTINGFDSDGLFTGDTSISFDNIMISSPCIRNGTCIGEDGNFILSGSDTYGYFSGEADITEVFNSLYSNFKNAFKIDSSLEGTRGLLPNYIIFGFLIMLLLYLLKR